MPGFVSAWGADPASYMAIRLTPVSALGESPRHLSVQLRWPAASSGSQLELGPRSAADTQF